MIESYPTIDAMWNDMLYDITHQGHRCDSRNGPSNEIIGWAGTLINPAMNFLANSRRAISPAYAAAELLWYLSRKNTVEALLPYAPQYENYLNEGIAYGAYGHRIAHNVAPDFQQTWDQLSLASRILRDKSETRQCIITMWRADDLLEACQSISKKDLPCTILWQFFVRDDSLHMCAYMRSNDIWLGTPYDIFTFTSVQQLMANTLGLKLGTYTHHVGSLHLYDKNEMAAMESQEALYQQLATLEHAWDKTWFASDLSLSENAVRAEQDTRECDGITIDAFDAGGLHTKLGGVLRDLVLCCGVHLNRWDAFYIHSPALRQGFETHANRRGKRSDG